jgi:hypothetical protein
VQLAAKKNRSNFQVRIQVPVKARSCKESKLLLPVEAVDRAAEKEEGAFKDSKPSLCQKSKNLALKIESHQDHRVKEGNRQFPEVRILLKVGLIAKVLKTSL